MQEKQATLVHVTVVSSGSYHNGAQVYRTTSDRIAVSDAEFSVVDCPVAECGQFRTRLRTRRELWWFRLRRLGFALGIGTGGACISVIAGLTQLTAVIATASILCGIAYITALVLLCRIFARSTRYILVRADGARRGLHELTLE